jgi:hypothetical protein
MLSPEREPVASHIASRARRRNSSLSTGAGQSLTTTPKLDSTAQSLSAARSRTRFTGQSGTSARP